MHKRFVVHVSFIAALLLASTAARSADAPDLSGMWSDGRLTLSLTAREPGAYDGTITLNGQTYPTSIRRDAGRGLQGAFTVGREQFPVSLAWDGSDWVLTSGNGVYKLARQGGGEPDRVATELRVPDWIKPGLVINFYSGAANHEGVQLQPDPNGPVVVDGKRYRLHSTNGMGNLFFKQVTIVATGKDYIAADVRFYQLIGPKLNVPSLRHELSVIGDARYLEEVWMNPAALAAMPTGEHAGMKVHRDKVTIGKQTFDAVSLSYREKGKFLFASYDAKTGLLLNDARDTADPNITLTNPQNQQTRMAGARRTAWGNFIGMRQAQTPWISQPDMPFAKVGRSLDYEGVIFVVNDMGKGVQRPVQATWSCESVVKGAAAFEMLLQGPDANNVAPYRKESTRCQGAALNQPLWISPDVLQKLKPEQQIDADPLTGVTTFVAGMQNGIAVVVQKGPCDTSEYHYDVRTGVVVFMRTIKDERILGTKSIEVTELRLVGQE